ncbi:hypothetical protein D6774_00345 [Candidatus Woesearchaeota archaeon]|nr:MAG: hypothetical protein D6774_00345 [Candidatus Woesearchaeota archaeon]
MRKAQGLPLNVIILAVLGIIVLVVLVFIFSDKASNVNAASACENNNGDCFDKGETCGKGDAKDYPVRSFLDCPDDQLCCQKIDL